MIYIMNYIGIFLCFFIANLMHLNKKIPLAICFIQFTLLIGLRYQIGADYSAYENMFYNIKNSNVLLNIDIVEPGYYLLNKMFSCLDNGFFYMNFLIAAITMFFFYISILKLSNHPFSSVLVFVSFCLLYQCMNQTRQMLALSLCFYSIIYLLNEDKRKFYLIIVIASLFHYSSLIILIINFVSIKFTKKTLKIYLILFILSPFIYNIFIYLLNFTPYREYLGSYYDNKLLTSVIINTIVRMIFLGFIMLNLKYKNMNKKTIVLMHMACICFFIQLLTLKSSFFARLSTYFFISYIVLIPELYFKLFRKKDSIVIASIIFVVAFSIYHYIYYKEQSNSMGIDDYKVIQLEKLK